MTNVVGSPRFIGREIECGAIAELLVEHDLVTLVGPGGVGKTTLANEMVSRLADVFDGGVHVAELSGSSDTDDVANMVARQMNVDSLEAMQLRSAGFRTLVILDNCESALRAAAVVAEQLTGDTTEIRVLATSRSPLYVAGERILTIAPFEVPAPDDHAAIGASAPVQLFLERAKAAGATWIDGEEHLSAVAHLVHMLNGLPLAIELAAARSRMLTPGELAAMLDRQLDVLARPGAGEHRHHSLRSAIRTSYEPLSKVQQAFFRRLAILPGPFDLSLAHAAAGSTDVELDTVERLGELVDASLVDARPTADGRTTFRLLDSIRAYGREQLDEAGETQQLRERYVNAMVHVADDIVMAALDAFSPEVLGQIRDQFVHLAAAISVCIEHDATPDRAYRMFMPFYGPTGANADVADLARRMRERWDAPAPLRAEALAIMGTAWVMRDDKNRGQLLQDALADPEATPLAKVIAHRTLGFMASTAGDLPAAQAHLDQAIELARPFSASFTRELEISRSVVIDDASESPVALEVLERVVAESAKNDELINVVWASVTIAYHRMLLGELSSARRAVERAVAIADDTGLSWSTSTAHRMMGSVLAIDEGWVSAAPHFRIALDVVLESGDVDAVSMTLQTAAGAAARTGDVARAEKLWATSPPATGVPAIRSLFWLEEADLGTRLGPSLRLDSGRLVSAARTLLGPTPSTLAPLDGASEIIAFADCEFDRSMRELRRNGERVHLEPQVYSVLDYLIERRGTVATREEILDEVWGDRFVSLTALSSRIADARRATGDDGKTQRVIRTVHGTGFSFVAEVR